MSTDVTQGARGRRFRAMLAKESIQILRDPSSIRVLATLQFGPDFSRDVEAGRPAEVQIVLYGRRSNASQIVLGYVSAIARDIGTPMQVRPPMQDRGRGRAAYRRAPLVQRESRLYMVHVPSLLGTLGLLIALVVTGQSVARERELGTFDQLMVSPLRVSEILIGKMLPPLMIGVALATGFLLVATFSSRCRFAVRCCCFTWRSPSFSPPWWASGCSSPRWRRRSSRRPGECGRS